MRDLFQSAPHFSSEANFSQFEPDPDFQVSIRASLQQRGEPPCLRVLRWRAAFQSAPHFSSEANDFYNDDYYTGGGVSIRASLQQRGEPGLRSPVTQ